MRTSYVKMAAVIFSRMKICFHMKAHLYFIGVYIINYRFIMLANEKIAWANKFSPVPIDM